MSNANFNHSTNSGARQARLGYTNPGWRGEVTELKARYLLQLQNLLRTARRLNNARVVFALSSLIARKQGIA